MAKPDGLLVVPADGELEFLYPLPVERGKVGRRRRSIGSQRALGGRELTPEDLNVILASLIDGVTRRLRDAHRACRTVVLRLRVADFTRATHSHTVTHPTSDTALLLSAAGQLLTAALREIAQRGIFTGQVYQGNTRATVSAGWDTMPVFMRSGGMLVERTRDVSNDAQNPADALTVHVTAGARGSFTR